MAKPGGSSAAAPVIYLLLSAVAVFVQWNKWQALHRTRNLLALVLAMVILLIAATYLLRLLRARRAAGL